MAVEHLNRYAQVRVLLRGTSPASFPPGMSASECIIHHQTTGELIRLTDVTIRPSFSALFSGGLGLAAHGTLGQGSVAAQIRTKDFSDFSQLHLSGTVDDVRLKRLVLAKTYFPALDGVVSGSGSLDTNGNGALTLQVSKMETTFHSTALVGYPTMRGTLLASFSEGDMSVDSLMLKAGQTFALTLQGKVHPLWQNGPDAELQLTGALRAPQNRLRPQYQKSSQGKDLKFSLCGKISVPMYSFK